MKVIHLLALVMSVAALLTGCMVPNAPIAEPVDAAPLWLEPEQISPGDPDPEIQLYWDNTQSMFGFSGSSDSPIGTVAVELTNLARFDGQVHTSRLVPDGEQNLFWQEADPLIIASSVLVRDKTGYTYTGEFRHGGPLTAAFQEAPEPDQVRVLVTDLLEQESELDVLISYVTRLFRSESRQQVRLYVAYSGYDGFVSYPVVKEDTLQIKTTYYAGQRPFVVIVTGPVAGVEQIHQVLMGTGVSFAQFMAENHRPQSEWVSFQPGTVLEKSILVEDPAAIRCTANLEAHPILKDCIAFSYRKVTANKAPFARLSLLAQTDREVWLSLGQVNWFRWAEQQGEDGAVIHAWESCEAPENMVLTLSPLEPGSVIPGRDAGETGVEDITIPAGSRLWELGILTGDASVGHAYAVQAQLTVPAMGNPLASTEAFDAYDIPFAAYGNADGDPDILTRIPDLKLMLSALAKLDDAAAEETVADIRIVIQNYETICQNNKEEEK